MRADSRKAILVRAEEVRAVKTPNQRKDIGIGLREQMKRLGMRNERGREN